MAWLLNAITQGLAAAPGPPELFSSSSGAEDEMKKLEKSAATKAPGKSPKQDKRSRLFHKKDNLDGSSKNPSGRSPVGSPGGGTLSSSSISSPAFNELVLGAHNHTGGALALPPPGPLDRTLKDWVTNIQKEDGSLGYQFNDVNLAAVVPFTTFTSVFLLSRALETAYLNSHASDDQAFLLASACGLAEVVGSPALFASVRRAVLERLLPVLTTGVQEGSCLLDKADSKTSTTSGTVVAVSSSSASSSASSDSPRADADQNNDVSGSTPEVLKLKNVDLNHAGQNKHRDTLDVHDQGDHTEHEQDDLSTPPDDAPDLFRGCLESLAQVRDLAVRSLFKRDGLVDGLRAYRRSLERQQSDLQEQIIPDLLDSGEFPEAHARHRELCDVYGKIGKALLQEWTGLVGSVRYELVANSGPGLGTLASSTMPSSFTTGNLDNNVNVQTTKTAQTLLAEVASGQIFEDEEATSPSSPAVSLPAFSPEGGSPASVNPRSNARARAREKAAGGGGKCGKPESKTKNKSSTSTSTTPPPTLEDVDKNVEKTTAETTTPPEKSLGLSPSSTSSGGPHAGTSTGGSPVEELFPASPVPSTPGMNTTSTTASIVPQHQQQAFAATQQQQKNLVATVHSYQPTRFVSAQCVRLQKKLGSLYSALTDSASAQKRSLELKNQEHAAELAEAEAESAKGGLLFVENEIETLEAKLATLKRDLEQVSSTLGDKRRKREDVASNMPARARLRYEQTVERVLEKQRRESNLVQKFGVRVCSSGYASSITAGPLKTSSSSPTSSGSGGVDQPLASTNKNNYGTNIDDQTANPMNMRRDVGLLRHPRGSFEANIAPALAFTESELRDKIELVTNAFLTQKTFASASTSSSSSPVFPPPMTTTAEQLEGPSHLLLTASSVEQLGQLAAGEQMRSLQFCLDRVEATMRWVERLDSATAGDVDFFRGLKGGKADGGSSSAGSEDNMAATVAAGEATFQEAWDESEALFALLAAERDGVGASGDNKEKDAASGDSSSSSSGDDSDSKRNVQAVNEENWQRAVSRREAIWNRMQLRCQ
ncbi:unnamed protein product [Amoebophrya sp. A25]|nr:unnamed protein product [Amoebophrya sp. A25]|eukprot:GSA25T00017415001.1